MSSPTVPTPAPDEAPRDRVAERSLPPRQGCECDSRRAPVLNLPRAAYVCPECHGYRRAGR